MKDHDVNLDKLSNTHNIGKSNVFRSAVSLIQNQHVQAVQRQQIVFNQTQK